MLPVCTHITVIWIAFTLGLGLGIFLALWVWSRTYQHGPQSTKTRPQKPPPAESLTIYNERPASTREVARINESLSKTNPTKP